MHKSTCTSELGQIEDRNDLVDKTCDDLETENEDPCHIGTPVCLPAVVWFENCDGERERNICKISIVINHV